MSILYVRERSTREGGSGDDAVGGVFKQIASRKKQDEGSMQAGAIVRLTLNSLNKDKDAPISYTIGAYLTCFTPRTCMHTFIHIIQITLTARTAGVAGTRDKKHGTRAEDGKVGCEASVYVHIHASAAQRSKN